MIPRPPSNIADTAIIKKLKSKKDDKDGLYHKCSSFIEIANPILDSISGGPFKFYTLHNRDHAKKLIHLAEHIIAQDTLESLSDFECLLLVYASYIHDMGMAATKDEIDLIIESQEYKNSILSWPVLHREFTIRREKLEKVKIENKNNLELEIGDLHSIALSNYLRPKHATPDRYKHFINLFKESPGGAELFEIRGVSFENELIDICESHNLDVAVLAELRNAHEERFPTAYFIADHIANVQFVSAVLRVTDILDFDFERTPHILVECLGLKNNRLPGSEVTLKEWEKHLSVKQLIKNEDELVVKATCQHPAIELAVRNFCDVIEGELRRTQTIIRRNKSVISNHYKFDIPVNVRPEIRSNGYTYMDLSLKLDESAIMSLLMGTNLYRNPLSSIREIIQNAVDACIVRTRLSPNTTYRPIVQITSERDQEGRLWILVDDNGIGMDRDILTNHFFRVGSSYYKSPEFKLILSNASLKSIPVVSKFGIGFLSVFMLADSVEIESKSTGLGGSDSVGRYIRVDRLGALAYVQEDPSIKKGTTLKIRIKSEFDLKRDLISETFQTIKQNVLRPPVPLEVNVGQHTTSISTTNTYSLRKDKKSENYRESNSLRIVTIPLEDYSDKFQGKVFLFFVQDNETLRADHNGEYLEITIGTAYKNNFKVNPKAIFNDFDGNRISVGGFRMIWPKLNRLLRKGNRFIGVVYDIDVKPGDDVEFDVARTRILDQRMTLRIELRRAIHTALKELGLYGKIEKSARELFKTKSNHDPFLIDEEILRRKAKIIEDQSLLDRAIKVLPEDDWPYNIHHKVADALNVSRTMAYNIVSTLIIKKLITRNPQYENRKQNKSVYQDIPPDS